MHPSDACVPADLHQIVFWEFPDILMSTHPSLGAEWTTGTLEHISRNCFTWLELAT
jgi:hypothetical protein